MVNIVQNLSQVHDISQNNIIIGDFNFADEVDEVKDTSQLDNMMNSQWEEFKSGAAIVDPLLKHYYTHTHTQRIYIYIYTT